MWAWARYDFGLSFEEFEELTPGLFWALGKRRNSRFKHERYAHAITASVVANSRRTRDEDPIVHPFDFVREDDQAKAKEERDKFKRFCKKVIGGMPMATPREKLMEVRAKAIKDLQDAGCDYAEALMRECWGYLTPKDGE